MVLVLIFFDFAQAIKFGTIKALGLQPLGVIVTLFCYYFIGLPLAYVLAFKKIFISKEIQEAT